MGRRFGKNKHNGSGGGESSEPVTKFVVKIPAEIAAKNKIQGASGAATDADQYVDAGFSGALFPFVELGWGDLQCVGPILLGLAEGYAQQAQMASHLWEGAVAGPFGHVPGVAAGAHFVPLYSALPFRQYWIFRSPEGRRNTITVAIVPRSFASWGIANLASFPACWAHGASPDH